MASVQPINIKLDNFGCNFSNNAPKTSRALEAIGAILPLMCFSIFLIIDILLQPLQAMKLLLDLKSTKKYIPCRLGNITQTDGKSLFGHHSAIMHFT